MNEQEREIAKLLGEAWNKFLRLEQTHPCHRHDFSDGIHKCQDVLIHRIVQRDYPADFPIYKMDNVNE